ncbi:MAG: hypothetical protein ABJA78_14695 [Ferruginibacter sp.]
MKQIILLIIIVFCISNFSCKKSGSDPVPVPPISDSFTVTVINGYGSNKYKVGDTVHIWSKEYSTTQLFDTWSGDNSLLNNNDWHAWFVMPARNVSFTGSIKNTAAFNLNFEQIRGRDRLKPVYSYFPPSHKGIVFLLHGSGGSAAQITGQFEAQQLIRELVNDGFAIIVTEAEEATTGVDVDGDGKLRWALTPADTLTNIDYINIRNITDTFYNRGTTSRSKPRYSVGMSNGGAFSGALSYIYSYKCGISYCAQALGALASFSNIPFQYCMQRYDNNPDVGAAGNAAALINSQTLTSRGICSKYFINEHSPLYPERFARRTDISIATSTALFNELKSKGFLNAKNYFIGYSSSFQTAFQTAPTQFPVYLSLTLNQKVFFLEQLDCCITDHQMYSDFSKLSLKFLNTQCL